MSQALLNAQPGEPPASVHQVVYISQVITEPVLVKKSSELEKALEDGNFTGNYFTIFNTFISVKSSLFIMLLLLNTL